MAEVGDGLGRLLYFPGVSPGARPSDPPSRRAGGGRREDARPMVSHRDEGASHRDEDAMHRDPSAAHRDEDAMHRDPSAAHRDEEATQGDEGAAYSDEGAEQEPGASRARERAARRAENVSMVALTRRSLSVSEMRRALAQRGLEDDAIDAEVERLSRVGLLDDVELARTLVRTVGERKGLGRRALAAELARRGIGSEAVAAALEDVDPSAEREAVFALARKRARQLRGVDHEAAVRRLAGFLARRGYSGELARDAIEDALGPRGHGVRFE